MTFPQWPAVVQCHGRRYEANTQEELDALLRFLVAGDKALANRFRVGASWPRGERAKQQEKRQVSAPRVAAWCVRCGREYILYRDLSKPCPYPPPGTRPSKENPLPPCGGRVVLVEPPQSAVAVDPDQPNAVGDPTVHVRALS